MDGLPAETIIFVMYNSTNWAYDRLVKMLKFECQFAEKIDVVIESLVLTGFLGTLNVKKKK